MQEHDATQPDRKCVDKIFEKAQGYYSGQWISLAWDYEKAGQFLEATHAYEKARNGFGQKALEWQCLEAWRVFTESKALASTKPLVLVMMNDEFYQQLDLPHLPLPMPAAEVEAIVHNGQWTFARLLDYLRYYLLSDKGKAGTHAPIGVRLAYEVALHEGLHGDIDKADYYFGLAKDFGRKNVIVTANVARGYLMARDYDKALVEYEQVRKTLLKTEAFVPDIWLHVANLHFYLGHEIKGRNVVKDYMAQAEALPVNLFRKVIEYGGKWAANYKAEKELIEMFNEASTAGK